MTKKASAKKKIPVKKLDDGKRSGFIDHGIFPGYTYFSCGMSYEEMIEDIKKNKDLLDWTKALEPYKDMIGNQSGLAIKTNINDNIYFFIILRNVFNFSDEDYIILAHECLHVSQFFMPIVLERDREIEAEAYFHSHLMRNCLDIIRNHK